MTMYKTLDEAMAAVEVAITDVTNDSGECSDENAYDLICSIAAYDCTPEVGRELCKVEIGWVPAHLGI
jgi:hypothetical protein